jgi:dTMP kinase
MAQAGVLVTVEGIGGSGKSTLARSLVGALRSRGYPVTSCREPGATALGTELRSLLLDPRAPLAKWTEAFLFEADRAQTYFEVIQPAIASGQVVVSDRNFYGTIAYQGFGRQLDIELIDAMSDSARNGQYPDVIFVVDVEPAVGLSRKSGQSEVDQFDREALDFQSRVREGFLFAASRDEGRAFVLDGSRSADDVLMEAISLLSPHLEQHGLTASKL